MITGCKESGLPEPDFAQSGGEFVVTIWRDWLTESALTELGLSERQKKGVWFVKEKGRITNTEYQNVTGVLKREAGRDLKELVDKGVFEKPGSATGKGTYYALSKGATKGPKGPHSGWSLTILTARRPGNLSSPARWRRKQSSA
jgi:ATP-dependent DNA helicase RecG